MRISTARDRAGDEFLASLGVATSIAECRKGLAAAKTVVFFGGMLVSRAVIQIDVGSVKDGILWMSSRGVVKTFKSDSLEEFL